MSLAQKFIVTVPRGFKKYSLPPPPPQLQNSCYFFRLKTDFRLATFPGIYIKFSLKQKLFHDDFCESKF